MFPSSRQLPQLEVSPVPIKMQALAFIPPSFFIQGHDAFFIPYFLTHEDTLYKTCHLVLSAFDEAIYIVLV